MLMEAKRLPKGNVVPTPVLAVADTEISCSWLNSWPLGGMDGCTGSIRMIPQGLGGAKSRPDQLAGNST